MKRIFLSALLCCLATFNPSQTYAITQATQDAVLNQQRMIVTNTISHCQKRLPLIANPEIAHKNAIVALDELSAFMSLHPDAFECVIDTFQNCINERCMNVPTRVHACIQNYESTERTISIQDIQVLQEKVNNLVVTYFKFQLTLLGKFDYYAQRFLETTQLGTYIELAKPWIFFAGVYVTISASAKAFESVLKNNTSVTETTIEKDAPKIEITKKTVDDNLEFMTNTLKSFTGGLFKEFDNSAAKLVASYILTPGIKTSLEKVEKYVGENSSRSYAQLISKDRKPGYPAKPSKESFATVKGYDDTKLLMTPTIDFCSFLTEYRAADIKIPRGYLFEGPLADGRKMAQALAGEMTKKLKALGSSAQWLVYEIHGSSLASKNLSKVLEECLEFGPTVLIINNLDWIYTQKDVEPEVYAEIINKLARYLSQESNFPLLICATTQDHTVIDPVMLEFHKFELVTLD